jgi:hypothetical protein
MRIATLLAGLLLALLAGCSGIGTPSTLTLGEADLQRLIERRFPLDRRYLEVIEVDVARPKLRLLPEVNRLAAVLDMDARDRVFGTAWHGRLAFDAALRWEPRDRSVRLQRVRVSEVTLADAARGVPAMPQAERIAALVAEQALEDMALYELPPDKAAQLQRLGIAPSAVTVTARGVEITFAPAPR